MREVNKPWMYATENLLAELLCEIIIRSFCLSNDCFCCVKLGECDNMKTRFISHNFPSKRWLQMGAEILNKFFILRTAKSRVEELASYSMVLTIIWDWFLIEILFPDCKGYCSHLSRECYERLPYWCRHIIVSVQNSITAPFSSASFSEFLSLHPLKQIY